MNTPSPLIPQGALPNVRGKSHIRIAIITILAVHVVLLLGIAHPRRLGIASHLGLWLELPTIGCGKSILTGHHRALSEEAGSWVPLIDKDETIGAVVRTRAHVKPMIISLGHRSPLETSIHYVLACCRGYRLPEPTRQADKLSKDNAWQEPEPQQEQQPTLWEM